MNKTLSRASIRRERSLVIAEAGHLAGAHAAMRCYTASLPPEAAGKWCRFSIFPPGEARYWAKLEIEDSARAQVVREAFFPSGGRFRAARRLLLHVPHEAGAVTLTLFSAGGQTGLPVLRVRVLARPMAALWLLAAGARSLAAALRGSPTGFLGRVRTLLGQRAARLGAAPPYSVWIDLFDRWTGAESAALSANLPDPGAAIEVAIISDGSPAALQNTLDSVAAQWGGKPPVPKVIANPADWTALWAVMGAPWVVVLQAGELLAPHATACFLLAAHRAPNAHAFCADFDCIDAEGTRHAPCLCPPPDPWLLRSDFFGDGAWMFSRIAASTSWSGPRLQARQLRLAIARRLRPENLYHIPLILTHLPTRTMQVRSSPSIGSKPDPAPRISFIVPSAARSPHVLKCLRRLVQDTDYFDYEILLTVSSIDPGDRVQAECLRLAAGLAKVRVIGLDMPDFNFAAVNNQASLHATGEFLLLLNDDVVPISPAWLKQLVTFVCAENAPCADIVGTRLLYGNRMVQHAGVVMGLANLCEHAFRLADRADPGPWGLACLDRQVSAVTAACMLVRRSLFESLGGFDEGFAIALNDVDFCLRAGESGARIVLAACVELYHFESLSLGRHYQGARAGLEAREVLRLRQRWAGVISGDPFYHPCASLEAGREFRPGFPPRQTPLSWIGQEPLALH